MHSVEGGGGGYPRGVLLESEDFPNKTLNSDKIKFKIKLNENICNYKIIWLIESIHDSENDKGQ